MVGRELARGELVDLFPDYEVSAAQQKAAAWLLYPSRAYLPNKVRLFISFLKAAFQHGAPWERPADSES